MRRSRVIVVAAPLAMLLIGGAVGYATRDDASTSSSSGTVVGTAVPTGVDLDRAAPVRPLPRARNTMLVDRDRIVGMPPSSGVAVPPRAALPLSLDSSGTATPVDPTTLRPVDSAPPAPLPPVQAAPLPAGATPAATPSTLPSPDATTSTVPTVRVDGYADPCVVPDSPCPGSAGQVLDARSDGTPTLDPLEMSLPFAATGDYAAACNAIEAGSVPDPFLSPATRPTVAVVVNQPSNIALTGTWSDGTPLEKLTMVTSQDLDRQWQEQWDTQHLQGTLLACLTLPLETVRAHAAAGRAPLSTGLLAISATGRAELSGAVMLGVPLDGEDPPFADQVTFTSLGEQRQSDGTLAPTVHVHYAFTNDTIVPPSSAVDPRTARVYASHALVENADCAGWAVNAQGLDRTGPSQFDVAFEQRTVSGRNRPVTVVDGDVTLDPVLPGGWQGFVCVRLFVADDAGNQATVALRGAPVRSPRTAVYAVGVQVIDEAAPEGMRVQATWRRADGSTWCGPEELGAGDAGVSCTTYARTDPDGITLMLRGVEPGGGLRPAFLVTVPVNTAYCNPDDPAAALSDGCNTGFTERIAVPLDATGDQSVTVSLTVLRTAAPGTFLTNPSHTWQIDPTQSFVF